MIPKPISPYAVSKFAGENYMRSFNFLYGLETISLRYFNVFGPKQDPNSQYSAVIPKFIKAIKASIQPIIYGDGLQSRDFTYISNIVKANILAATKECHTPLLMNCATHGQITINKLVAEINKILGKDIQSQYDPKRSGDIKHSFADIDLIKKELDFSPNINFESGLKKTIHSYYPNNQ
jgi:UDP-glucose 4-epimerase